MPPGSRRGMEFLFLVAEGVSFPSRPLFAIDVDCHANTPDIP